MHKSTKWTVGDVVCCAEEHLNWPGRGSARAGDEGEVVDVNDGLTSVDYEVRFFNGLTEWVNEAYLTNTRQQASGAGRVSDEGPVGRGRSDNAQERAFPPSQSEPGLVSSWVARHLGATLISLVVVVLVFAGLFNVVAESGPVEEDSVNCVAHVRGPYGHKKVVISLVPDLTSLKCAEARRTAQRAVRKIFAHPKMSQGSFGKFGNCQVARHARKVGHSHAILTCGNTDNGVYNGIDARWAR